MRNWLRWAFLAMMASSVAHEAWTEGTIVQIRAHTESGEEMNCRLTLIGVNGQSTELGQTEDGVRTLRNPIQCEHGMSIRADPWIYSLWYFPVTVDLDPLCSNPYVIVFEQQQFASNRSGEWSKEAQNLAHNIDLFASTRNYATLTLLYADLASEIRGQNEPYADEYSRRAVLLWSLATGAEEAPYPELERQIRQEQATLGVPQTGRLDYATLAGTANREVHWFRHTAYMAIDAAPERRVGPVCNDLQAVHLDDGLDEADAVVGKLIQAAQEKEDREEHGVAALLYNEAGARSGDTGNVREYAAMEVYENVAREIGIHDAVWCDPEQGRFVMSPALLDGVREFQMRRSLEATGKLDYETLRELAQDDVGLYLAGAGVRRQ